MQQRTDSVSTLVEMRCHYNEWVMFNGVNITLPQVSVHGPVRHLQKACDGRHLSLL